ncbi:MAG TPA: hypothetical protein VNL14_16655 [Candidatus Acidoferrales bacterium]|nr:hypothetical protein [Candidatus Acidoferrales bacterium]
MKKFFNLPEDWWHYPLILLLASPLIVLVFVGVVALVIVEVAR